MKKETKLDPDYIKVMQKPYTGLSPMLLALKIIKPGSRVLSIGCGARREVKYLLDQGCKVVAIDYDKEMIRSSKKIAPEATYFNLEAIKALEQTLDKEIKYNYIICLWNTINFMKKQQRKRFIEFSYNHLQIGGQLILTTSHILHHWRFPLHNIKHRTMYYYFPSEINYWFKELYFHGLISLEKIRIQNTNLIVMTRHR